MHWFLLQTLILWHFSPFLGKTLSRLSLPKKLTYWLFESCAVFLQIHVCKWKVEFFCLEFEYLNLQWKTFQTSTWLVKNLNYSSWMERNDSKNFFIKNSRTGEHAVTRWWAKEVNETWKNSPREFYPSWCDMIWYDIHSRLSYIKMYT